MDTSSGEKVVSVRFLLIKREPPCKVSVSRVSSVRGNALQFIAHRPRDTSSNLLTFIARLLEVFKARMFWVGRDSIHMPFATFS